MAKGPPSQSPPRAPAPGETQVIDLADVDLVLPEELKRIAPPPLPPEEIARASQAPPPSGVPVPPVARIDTEAPPARSSRVYVIVLAACLVTCALAGLAVMRSMRKSVAPAPAPSGRVITISPVEMNDDVDGGK